jgi:quercetin dioxygenase-like cupin family protein
MKTSLTEFKKKARLVKKSDRYEVYDLVLDELALSMTVLHQDKSTVGHSHDDTEEVYLLVEGKGQIQLDNEKQEIVSGDIIIVPRGAWHRIFNLDNSNLTFLSLFKKYHGRGK